MSKFCIKFIYACKVFAMLKFLWQDPLKLLFMYLTVFESLQSCFLLALQVKLFFVHHGYILIKLLLFLLVFYSKDTLPF